MAAVQDGHTRDEHPGEGTTVVEFEFTDDGIRRIDQIRMEKLRAVRQQHHISLLLPLGCAAGDDKYQVRIPHELRHKRILPRNATHREHHDAGVGRHP